MSAIDFINMIAIIKFLFQVIVQYKGVNEDGLRAEIDPNFLWNQLVTLVSELCMV